MLYAPINKKRPRLREGVLFSVVGDQVTAIGAPFEPVAPFIGAGEKM